jgi:hypothetical protein
MNAAVERRGLCFGEGKHLIVTHPDNYRCGRCGEQRHYNDRRLVPNPTGETRHLPICGQCFKVGA